MDRPIVISVYILVKGKSYRRIVFYQENDGVITATIQCNCELDVYSVSQEFAVNEIEYLQRKGYKILF